MKFKPKKYRCIKCDREQYTNERCFGCGHRVFVELTQKVNYEAGDIIRFENDELGLYEITCVHEDAIYEYSITNDGCNSETYAKHEDMIFVCSIKDRKDI